FRAMLTAAEQTGMPHGVVSLIHGASYQPGIHLVQHPLIQAVGFTGSFRGGKALFDPASQRPVPIPGIADMGSTTPAIILPGALKERGAKIAEGLAASVTLGVGQFCTHPGLVLMEKSDGQPFKNSLAGQIENHPGGTMLTENIRKAYLSGLDRLKSTPGV